MTANVSHDATSVSLSLSGGSVETYTGDEARFIIAELGRHARCLKPKGGKLLVA